MMRGYGFLLGILLVIQACSSQPTPSFDSLIVQPKPKDVVEFSLRNHHDEPFTNHDLSHWALLFFGYSHCPDVCPTELALIAQTVRSLKKDGKPAPKVYFVTLDPARDTATFLRDYLQYFHPDFIGVTGDTPQLEKLYRQFQVMHERDYPDPKNRAQYLINHSAAIYLINPDGQYYGVFPAPHEAASMLADLRRL
jgi:protein SCO1